MRRVPRSSGVLAAVIDAAATWRLTSLVVDDEITRPARDWIATYLPEGSKLGYLVNCRACTSMWAALMVGLADRKSVV